MGCGDGELLVVGGGVVVRMGLWPLLASCCFFLGKGVVNVIGIWKRFECIICVLEDFSN